MKPVRRFIHKTVREVKMQGGFKFDKEGNLNLKSSIPELRNKNII
jgi:hypothetical protein